jgi:5-methylcytosine-specific restriction endonuclease McrA
MTREEEVELAWQHLDWPFRINAIRRLRKKRRERLAEAQNWRCCYCGNRMDGSGCEPNAPTFEHVIPRSLGGTDDEDNLVIACQRCNELRGNEPLTT